jgi:hypothetical protein
MTPISDLDKTSKGMAEETKMARRNPNGLESQREGGDQPGSASSAVWPSANSSTDCFSASCTSLGEADMVEDGRGDLRR